MGRVKPNTKKKDVMRKTKACQPKTETAPKLPKKLPSAVCAQYVRCGKPQCRCNNGQLHGPYYFYFYRINGKLKKTYIRKAAAEVAWESYQQRRAFQKEVADNNRRFTEMCRDLRRFDHILALLKRLEG